MLKKVDMEGERLSHGYGVSFYEDQYIKFMWREETGVSSVTSVSNKEATGHRTWKGT